MKKPTQTQSTAPTSDVPEPDDTEPVTLGDIMKLTEEEPVLPGFEYSDTPLQSPLLRSTSTHQRTNVPPSNGKDGEILPPSRSGGIPRYESRIRILDAWQYNGSLTAAPTYVDRNWVGYANDHDPIRNINPGPCLRVPLTPDPEESTVVIARVGDYVVHEEIVGDDGNRYEKVEVWEKDQFRRLFLPA